MLDVCFRIINERSRLLRGNGLYAGAYILISEINSGLHVVYSLHDLLIVFHKPEPHENNLHNRSASEDEFYKKKFFK